MKRKHARIVACATLHTKTDRQVRSGRAKEKTAAACVEKKLMIIFSSCIGEKTEFHIIESRKSQNTGCRCLSFSPFLLALSKWIIADGTARRVKIKEDADWLQKNIDRH